MNWVRPSVVQVPRDGLVAHGTWVTPGEELCEDVGFLRGHGTYVKDGMLIAAVAGIVERVNKLVSVRAYKQRYVGEVGDVVIGRVIDVGAKRWKIDANARQHSVLLLSSINLPGGEQRRRTAEDQLNMRQFYIERDVLSAEVQTFFSDGAMSLHTRSLKYGKLTNGTLVTVTASLVRRAKQHFHTFDFGVAVIFGMNGYVWVGPAASTSVTQEPEAPPAEVTLEMRERICRVRNALVVLNCLFMPVAAKPVQSLYELSRDAGMAPCDMLQPANVLLLGEQLRKLGGLFGAPGSQMDE